MSNNISSKCRRVYEKALALAEELVETAAGSDEEYLASRAELSGWSIGQHLDHMANANREMAGAIQKILAGEAGSSRSGLTVVGRAVLTTGWIPRGVGKAPDYTTPKATSSNQIKDNLSRSLEAVRQLGDVLPGIDSSRGRADHFAFGGLTPIQWLRVIDVHTRHHLKIIRDIERAAS
jgi:hypothetical protein